MQINSIKKPISIAKNDAYEYREPVKNFNYKLPKIKMIHPNERSHKNHAVNVMFNQYNELNKLLFKN
jgi:hypothetical protein